MSQIDPSLFKAYDVRATIDRLTPAAAYLIARAIGSQAVDAGFKRIVVARDGRLSSPALAESLRSGLSDSGLDVLDLGLAATPVLYFAAKHEADGCGVVVTGSHNPPAYNGIKMMLGGETVDGEALQRLRQRIENDDFVDGVGQITKGSVTAAYDASMVKSTPLARSVKLVVDCGNGVAGAFAPDLYRQMGCEVTPLFCEVDGHFPNHHPDPQQPENLRELQAAVLKSGAEVGLAFDGDGDRLGVITRQGRVIEGDRLLMLFAEQALKKQSGHVLYDVKSSRQVARWVADLGGSSAAIPTGHSHMKRALKSTQALLAGELSGHFAFAEWGFDDALYAGAKVLQMLAEGLDLDARLAALPATLATPELQLAIEENGHALIAKIAKKAQFPSAERVFEVDGLRIEYVDGFGLIRASNTTPVLTLRIEADNMAAITRIQQELAVAIAPLPFPQWNLL